MALLAILLLAFGMVLWRLRRGMEFPLQKRLLPLQWAAWILGGLLLLGAMAVVVPAGHAGVVVLFGKVKAEPLPSGLHLVNPLANIVEMEVRTRNYTMTSAAGEGQVREDDSISVITSDGLSVKLDATVLYSLIQIEVPKIYREIGRDVDEKIVRSAIRAALRDTAAGFQAMELYGARRTDFVRIVSEGLAKNMDPRGIRFEQFLLRDVKLPDQITRSINDKISADQEAQKMAFVLQKEKQEAERKRIEAEGQARAQQIVSQSLTPQILEYQRIQALREIGAKGNLIITGSGGATPMIQVPARGPDRGK